MSKAHAFQDLQTRFLWPFVVARDRVPQAIAALQADRYQGATLWTRPEPPHAYRDEYLGHVAEFVFGASGDCCAYLVLDPAIGARWLKGVELNLGGEAWLPLARRLPAPHMEAFLSPHGVGVLSLNLAPSVEGLTTAQALDFNYRLAQFRRRNTAVLRKRHPARSPDELAEIPAKDRAKMAPAPLPTADIDDRLAGPGGTFEPRELLDRLLQPLDHLGWRAVQNELSVFTVVRLEQGMDLGDPGMRDELAPLLSGLAQVEESRHAGAPRGLVTTNHTVLNRSHWAAVGSLGSAHLVADQGGIAFDEQRVGIVRDKYFIAYLIALQQRVVLNQVVDEAGGVARSLGSGSPDGLKALRYHVLEFAVRGHFAQVSSRHAVQRWYELACEGMRVARSWSDVRSAIEDINAQDSSEQQRSIARRTEQHLDTIQRVQTFVHVLEYVLISVYFAHLWHMLDIHFTERRPWIGILMAAALGLLGARTIDRWVHSSRAGRAR